MFRDFAPKPRPGGIQRARKLRKSMTLPEVMLWQLLRARPYGLKFRRQHQTGDYTLDFYCGDARLAIEVDGMIHDDPSQARHDGQRDAWLAGHGIETLRIPASEVLADVTQSAEAIVDYARARLPLHHPAARGGPPLPLRHAPAARATSPSELGED